MAPLLTCLLVLGAATAARTALPSDPGARLRAAAALGDLTAVEALLDAGVDADAASEYGATALALAADKGYAEVVKALLEHGAVVGATDSFYQSTPISWAAYNGHAQVVRLLLAAGADFGPALGMAVERNKPEVVRGVLEWGKATPEVLARVLVAAKAGGKGAIVKLLEEAGVGPPPPAAVRVDPGLLAGYAGLYQSDQFHYLRGEDIYLVISVADGTLKVAFMDQPAMALSAVDETRFCLAAFAAVTLRFVAAGGVVSGVEVDQAGTRMTARRVQEPGGEPP